MAALVVPGPAPVGRLPPFPKMSVSIALRRRFGDPHFGSSPGALILVTPAPQALYQGHRGGLGLPAPRLAAADPLIFGCMRELPPRGAYPAAHRNSGCVFRSRTTWAVRQRVTLPEASVPTSRHPCLYHVYKRRPRRASRPRPASPGAPRAHLLHQPFPHHLVTQA